MFSLQVGQNLYLSSTAETPAKFQKVDLTGAKVDGWLVMQGVTVLGTLDMNSIHVGHHVLLRGTQKALCNFQGVALNDAKVDGRLVMEGVTVQGTLDMSSLKVGQNVRLRSVENAPSKFRDVDIAFARLGGNLDLSGAEFVCVKLSGSHIEEELRLGSSQRPPSRWSKIPISECSVDPNTSTIISDRTQERADLSCCASEVPQLDLRNAHAGALQDWVAQGDVQYDEEKWSLSWPSRMQIDGFTYDRLGGIGTTAGAEMLSRPVDWYIHWLERDPSYSPEPYQQLAATFSKAGEPVKAQRILYESRKRARQESERESLCIIQDRWCLPVPNLQWWGLSLLELTTGYGIGLRYFRALGWVVGLTLLGAIILHVQRQEPQGFASKLFFSLDQLIPRIVQLDKVHDEVEKKLTSGVRRYFYFHKIAGYVLAGFLLAGLAGLTQT
jgi:hypothetical protein